MDRNHPSYFRPMWGWAIVVAVIAFGVTYAASGQIVPALLVALGAAAVESLFWHGLLTIGERPRRRRRQVDESRLR